MENNQPTPLQAAFWLTKKERCYILIICTLALLGMLLRHHHLKTAAKKPYIPAQIENAEHSDD